MGLRPLYICSILWVRDPFLDVRIWCLKSTHALKGLINYREVSDNLCFFLLHHTARSLQGPCLLYSVMIVKLLPLSLIFVIKTSSGVLTEMLISTEIPCIICVERSIRSKSSTYSEIFSGIRICASYKNHPVQKYRKNPLNTSTVKIANRNLKYCV